ncbi:leucine-rich PPR motif-containing protein, mitochondrial [Elysia marginata]|uniref:Leucine-rich PPR motif-containing protein, mitochondrial n=1 Tax=Elysia marginata TaxID=1093978 RepID=A0AAV4HFT0_9GAST|nr:leucine-rich PPR motif-containing protein, mitochondrial [Elysia marginata]
MAALIRCGLLGLSFRAGVFPQSKNIVRYRLTLPYGSVGINMTPPVIDRSMVTSAMVKDKVLDDVHRKLDYNQGIPTQLFESLRASLEDQGTLVEQDFGLLLHICSNGPFDCPTSKRLQLVDEIWSKLEGNDLTPSTKLYNIKLKAYCRNKKHFNALDELMNMKKLGLNPDKITYSLLIEGFCLKGDIEGANSVLEAMKASQLAINVTVFNSFITGHLKAGSPEEASKVLDLISSSGLSPNSQTYFNFASFYAEEGDMDSVVKYMMEAEELGISLEHSMLLDLHRTMVANGHASVAAKLLQIISEKGVFSLSFMQKSCHLVAEGFVDAAVELYTVMPKADDGKLLNNSGSFLIKSMVVNGHNAQDIFNTADKVVEICPRSIAHRNALLYAYKADQIDLAVELLELMISKNHTIKVPYIVPAICGYQKEKNSEGVYRATKLLLNLPFAGIRDDKIDQLVRCSYPALLQCGQSREDIVERFKEHEKLWNSIFFLDDVLTQGFDVAINNAEGKQLDGSPFQWADGPNNFFKFLPQQIDSCVKALEFFDKQPSFDQENLNYLTGRLVRYFINSRNWSLLEKFLDGLLEKKIFLVQTLKQISLLKEAPSNIIEKMDQLCVGTSSLNNQQRPRTGKHLTLSQLEQQSEEEVKEYLKKNPDRFLPRLVLLHKAMDADDLESIKQRLREIQALDFSLTLVQTMRVITKLIQLKETEMAIFYFDELKKQTGDSYKPTVPLMIAEELVKQGNIEGALELITAAKNSQHSPDTRTKLATRAMFVSMLQNAPTVEDVSALHSAMFHSDPIYSGTDSTFIHGSYIRKMSELQDDSELVNTVLNVYQAHHIFPVHDFVLERLIKKKDVENLKKVMDIGNAAFGSNFFHHKLAISFIRCGMPARGATILKTPGLKMNERLISVNCQAMVRRKEIDALESMVNVMKEMPVSQATMLSHLVEGYVTVGNLKQATESIQQFALDYNLPPRKTVEFLLKAYESSKEDAPEVLKSLLSKCSESATQSQDSSSLDSDSSPTEGSEPPSRTDSAS